MHDPLRPDPPRLDPPAVDVSARPGRRPRLLAVGDAVASTGFARVMHAVLGGLARDFDVHQLGVNYFGDPHPYPWPIYPAQHNGNPYGVGRIGELIDKLRPDVVLMVNDLWILGDLMDALADRPALPRIVLYTPIEAGPVDPRQVARLRRADRLVAYTRFGRDALADALAEARDRCRRAGEPELDLALDVIPHGVDTQTFRPLAGPLSGPLSGSLARSLADDSRRQARQRLFPDLSPDMFAVLNANRNQPRKRIDTTLLAFAEFARDKPADVRLCLHMGLRDAGWDILYMAERLGIADRLILTGTRDSIPEFGDEALNLLFNACDVGLNTATTEGWGLVPFEHAAAGAAQVMTAHEAGRELWSGCAELVEPAATLWGMGPCGVRNHFAAPADVAAALDRLYRDRDHLARMQAAAYANATRPEYQWSTIVEAWRRVLGQATALAPRPAMTPMARAVAAIRGHDQHGVAAAG